MLHVVFKVSTL